MSTPNTIQAGDLRVGNWVMVAGKLIQVTSIDEHGINLEVESSWYGECESNYDGYFTEDWFMSASYLIHPIELTPTILEECGFIEDETGFAYHLGKLSINLPNFNAYINGRTYFNSWCIIEGVPSYLHQLQNLIYSLTGKELNYQPLK